MRACAFSLFLHAGFTHPLPRDAEEWKMVWEVLRGENISNQLIWILRRFCHKQTSFVRNGAGDSKTFHIFLVCDNRACWDPGCKAPRLSWQCPRGGLQTQRVGYILALPLLDLRLQMTSSFQVLAYTESHKCMKTAPGSIKFSVSQTARHKMFPRQPLDTAKS